MSLFRRDRASKSNLIVNKNLQLKKVFDDETGNHKLLLLLSIYINFPNLRKLMTAATKHNSMI